MSVPYKRFITTISNHSPKLLALMVEWENSHNFCLENLDNCLHYSIDFLILYGFQVSLECSAIFGVNAGADEFCHQGRINVRELRVQYNCIIEFFIQEPRYFE